VVPKMLAKRNQNDNTICVCARFRPQNGREKEKGGVVGVDIKNGDSVEIKDPVSGKLKTYNFDAVFDKDTSQNEVFKKCASHMIPEVIKGFNCTIFAYGQTGSGKTYSMEGEEGSKGIIPRLVDSLFEAIADQHEDMEFKLGVSYIEIYMEKLQDLLDPTRVLKKSAIQEDKNGVKIQGVKTQWIGSEDSPDEVLRIFEFGSKNRKVEKTEMNSESSRSHGVFILNLIKTDTQTGVETYSKLMMVDLAGSEKVRNTGASGLALKQAQAINKSLSALGDVMNSLSGCAKFVPYRNSVLTRLLSDSLGGNCKTTLLVCASSSDLNRTESLSTLGFGKRAKTIVNNAIANVKKSALEYKKELDRALAKIGWLEKYVDCLKKDLAHMQEGTLKNVADGLSQKFHDGLLRSPDKRRPTGKEVMIEQIVMDPNIMTIQDEERRGSGTSTTTQDSITSHSSTVSMSSCVSIESKLENPQKEIKVKAQEIKDLLNLKNILEMRNKDSRRQIAKLQAGSKKWVGKYLKQRKKVEQAEISYEQLFVEKQILRDECSALTFDRSRLIGEKDEFRNDFEKVSEELKSCKEKYVGVAKAHEDQLEVVRKEERETIEAFMEQARKAIANRVGHARTKSQRFLSAGSQEPENVILENLRLRQSLSERVQMQIDFKLKLYEEKEKNEALNTKLQENFLRLRNQHSSLQALADLKVEVDKVHRTERVKLENENKSLKQAITELQQSNSMLDHNLKEIQSETSSSFDKELHTARNKLIKPIRGKRKKKRKKTATNINEEAYFENSFPPQRMPTQPMLYQMQMPQVFDNRFTYYPTRPMQNMSGSFLPMDEIEIPPVPHARQIQW